MNKTTTDIIYKYLADTHGMAYQNLISLSSENYYYAFACDKWIDEITNQLEQFEAAGSIGGDLIKKADSLNKELVREAYENGHIEGLRTLEKFIRGILEIVEHAEDTNVQDYALV